jgi:hypothetical protein
VRLPPSASTPKHFPVPAYLDYAAWRDRLYTFDAKGKLASTLGESEAIGLPTGWDRKDCCALLEIDAQGSGVRFVGAWR